MKKKFALMTAISLLACVVLCSCDNTKYTVQLDMNYSGSGETTSVTTGSKLSVSEEPKREGYNFIGWFKDKNLAQKWDNGKDKVTEGLTLYAGWDKDTGDEIQNPSNDKDFTKLNTPGKQEEAYDYSTYFLPEKDEAGQGFVGDTMPYYEDGTFYIYYLKESGDSYNHSIYLTTTKDFVTYIEQQEVVLEASRSGGQDSWIGTGSVVKVEGKYYFFYTGHGSATSEYAEKVMVAESDNLTSFTKIADWEITPPDSLKQKNDFRDPQAYYDSASGKITLTITASQDGTARILKYTLDKDLSNPVYDGIIFSNTSGENFWNLECSDTFKIGDKWYISYSAQDDTLWYASADSQYGPYGDAKRLEGKLFYAAKHVEDGNDSYMVGWGRRAESVSSTQDVGGWAGNVVVQKIAQKENGDLYLVPVDAVSDQFTVRRELKTDDAHITADSGSLYSYFDAFTCYESFKLTGEFTYTGSGSFGLAFDYNNRQDKYKTIVISPDQQKVQFTLNEGKTLIAENAAELEAGKTYTFTYIQEGSVGVFYIDGMTALTVRVYGVSGKTVRIFAENNTAIFTSLRQYTKA